MSDATARFWRKHEFSLLVAIVFVMLLTTILDVQHNYWNNPKSTLVDLTRQTSQLGLIALGAAIVIISGGIDLSTGSIIAFSGTICASLLLLLSPEAMLGNAPLDYTTMGWAIAGTLLVGLLVGSLHAWLITVVGLPPFVATLGTLVGLRSLSMAIIENVTLAVMDGASSQINIKDPAFRHLATSIWIPAVLLGILAMATWVLLGKTVVGRHLYALGGNEQAARLSGIRTDRLKWLAYCLNALLASLAGIIAIGDQSSAAPQTLGRGAELNAIAAAVVGGCSLQGGIGTVPGTILGALFLRVVIDSVSKIIKTGAHIYEGFIVGVLVVFAVTFTRGSDSARQRESLFKGWLGLVTILNLTLLSGTMMALVGSKLVATQTPMDTAWLANLTGASTCLLLLLVRTNLPVATKRRLGLGWAVATVVLFIAADQAFPGWQRSSAVSNTVALGGRVFENEQGIVVDLNDSRCGDADLRKLASRLRFFGNLHEIRIQRTAVTDDGLKPLEKLAQLRRLDITGSKITTGGATRLKRFLSNLETDDVRLPAP
jgi:ribose/xylose/arabinose/galactoside ABC-type transport system permease subunit